MNESKVLQSLVLKWLGTVLNIEHLIALPVSTGIQGLGIWDVYYFYWWIAIPNPEHSPNNNLPTIQILEQSGILMVSVIRYLILIKIS